MQITRFLDLRYTREEAERIAADMRFPARGIHTEVVESLEDDEWNIRLVINEPHALEVDTYYPIDTIVDYVRKTRGDETADKLLTDPEGLQYWDEKIRDWSTD